MGNCLQTPVNFFREFMRRRARKTVTLLLVGLDDSGKSMVLKRLRRDDDNDVVPTVGFKTENLDSEHFKIVIYEVGGGSQIRAIWPRYYSDVFGVIYVVDASNRLRLGENKAVFNDMVTNEHIAGKPILLLGNKQDLTNAVDELDMVESLEVEQVVNRMRCPTRVETCSSVIGKEEDENNLFGIREGYKWLLDTIFKNYTYLNSRIKLAAKLEKRRRSSIASGIASWSDSSLESGSSGNKERNGLKTTMNKFFFPNNKTAPLSERALSAQSNVLEGPIPIRRSSSNAEVFFEKRIRIDPKAKQNGFKSATRPKTAPHTVENNFLPDLL